MKKEELVKFLKWYKNHEVRYLHQSPELAVKHYIEDLTDSSSQHETSKVITNEENGNNHSCYKYKCSYFFAEFPNCGSCKHLKKE